MRPMDYATFITYLADNSQLGRYFSSPYLINDRKDIRDAVHDLATRAAVSKTDIVASATLGITLSKYKPKQSPLMDVTSEEIKTALKLRHLVDKTHHYILIDPSLLRFVCPTDALLPYSISYTSGVRKAESIPLHDDECKQYLGYFPGDPDQDTQTKLLQCAKGPHFDTSGQGYTDLGRADGGYGTCTVIGDSRQE